MTRSRDSATPTRKGGDTTQIVAPFMGGAGDARQRGNRPTLLPSDLSIIEAGERDIEALKPIAIVPIVPEPASFVRTATEEQWRARMTSQFPELSEAVVAEQLAFERELLRRYPNHDREIGGPMRAQSLSDEAPNLRSGLHPTGFDPAREIIYAASRASLYSRPAMWRAFRSAGVQIISTWIDEDGEGETECFTELWDRIKREIAAADRLVLYAETSDFPLKGALIEVGIALGMGKPVTVCLPGVEVQGRTHRPVGSWIEHRLVTRQDNIRTALSLATGAA